jgi:hypothetical protein
MLGLGGALFVFLSLWLFQGMLGLGSRLMIGAGGAILLFGIVGVLAIGSAFVLNRTFRLSGLQATLVALCWLVMYLVLWAVGRNMGGVSLPVYLLCWLVFGAVGGYVIASQPAPRQRTFAPRTSSVVRSSEFGRVPSDTVVLLSQHVRYVNGTILGGVPEEAGQEARDITARTVLNCTLRDWWENGNTSGLGQADVADLRSFVELAASVAFTREMSDRQVQRKEALAVYRAMLNALLDDWFANWNANGVEGPPRR